MSYQITKEPHRIGIKLTDLGSDKEILLRHLSKYTGDTCTAPQYQTLQSMSTRPLANGIELELNGRAGTPLDLNEAENCLDTVVREILQHQDSRS